MTMPSIDPHRFRDEQRSNWDGISAGWGNAIATLVIRSRPSTAAAKASGVNTSCGPSKVKTPLAPASRSTCARSIASVGPNSAVITFTA